MKSGIRSVRGSAAAPVLMLGLLAAMPAAFAQMAGRAPAAQTGAVVKYGPGVSESVLLARPDTDLVELPNGRRVAVADIRRLATLRQQLRTTARAQPSVLTTRPAATGTPVRNRAELAAALKRPDTDTVVLPSGRRATVAQIRRLQPYVERQTRGAPTAARAPRPNLSGAAIKVTAQSDLKTLLQQPDSTVLESPVGTRVTVGELKQALAQSQAGAGRPARGR